MAGCLNWVKVTFKTPTLLLLLELSLLLVHILDPSIQVRKHQVANTSELVLSLALLALLEQLVWVGQDLPYQKVSLEVEVDLLALGSHNPSNQQDLIEIHQIIKNS